MSDNYAEICQEAINIGLPQLTRKELMCLKFIINGYTAKEIARKTNTSHRTVECHVAHLKQKFYCQNTIAMIGKLIREHNEFVKKYML